VSGNDRATPQEHVMFAALPAVELARRFLPDAWAQRLLGRGARMRLAETGFADWA
jgi:hypothetical protein